MGQCKECGASTSDGEEYCESCLLLKELGLGSMTDESGEKQAAVSEQNASHEELEFLDDLNIDEEFLNHVGDENVPFALDDSDFGEEEEKVLGTEEKDNLDEYTQDETGSDEKLLSLDESQEEELLSLDEEQNEEPLSLDNLQEDVPFVMEDNLDGIFAMEQSSDEVKKSDKPSDVSDILSDALGVLNDTSDLEGERKILGLVPDVETKEKEQSKKVSFLKRLFANIETDEDEEPERTEEELKQIKEEKEAVRLEKAKKKEEKKETKKKLSEEKKQKKDARKQEKKLLKEEELKKVPVDHGRINKAGAAVVFVFFGIVAGFVVIGTNTFTYAHSVNSAKNYFDMQKYEKAYDQLNGIDVKSKDEEIYDKIITVMVVQKQLNSYENYYNMKMYPEALDSLVKGIKRYNEYIDSAKKLNVDSDLSSIKEKIVDALKKSYGLKESDISYLLKMESQEEYSQEIYELSKEN